MLALWWAALAQAVDICEVGCPFSSVRQAVSAVGPGEEVEFLVMPGNYVEEGSIVVPAGTTIRLLGQGAVTLTNVAQGPVILASGEGSVLTIDTFTLTAVNDRIFEVTEGQVKLSRSVLYTMGVVDEGGAVRVGPGASFVADDTLFIDSVATSAGGHLMAREATVDLTNCRFSGGYARHGGSISAEGGTTASTVTISGSTFEENLAAEAGGAISMVGNVVLSVENARFENNTADRGGALADYALGGMSATVQIGTTVFEGNTADGNGGALASTSGTWTLTDSTFSRNSAIDGGALWILGGLVSMDRGLLCENVARNAGGAVSTDTELLQIWFNNRLIENIADRGGAVDHTGGRLELRHTNLIGNSAPVGGAVRSDTEVLVYDSLVAWTEGGTALLGEEVTERRNAFWRNVAGDIQEGTAAGTLAEGDIRADPQLERYQAGSGCEAADDYYSWYGPLRGAADPLEQPNLDGSAPPDIGAFGGQFAPGERWTDTDGDLFPPLYDCVEGDESIHPEAFDEPYDGLDRNCDMADDSDADGDGYRPPDDCNDADEAIHPGAIELPNQGDQNCDGRADADGDGYSPPDDCNDGAAHIHPGATEDPHPAELDCQDPYDVPRPLVPRTCSTVGEAGLWPLVLLLLLFRKRS